MPKMLPILGCGLAVLAAPFLLLQGLANARMSPALVDWNGYWKADVASALVQVQQTELSLELNVNQAGLVLAQEAFAAEPLASDALFPIAIAWQSDGRADDANGLIDTGLRLDKRNRQLGVLALQREAVAQNLPGLFSQINRLAVLNPPLINDFVQPLTAALDDEASLLPIRDALAAEPNWAEAFWNSVPRTQDGVRNMYALRQLTDMGVTRESDEKLLEGLGRAQLFSETLDHWDKRFASAEDPATVFLASDQNAPIGWQTTRSGDISLSARGNGAFEVYIENQASGELARQLVRLSPGEYVLSAGIAPASEAEHITGSLVCAGAEDETGQTGTFPGPIRFTATSECSVYWLILSGSAFETRGALEARISAIQFGSAQ